MERPDEERGTDTGKIELERIINCLKDNSYVYEGLEDSDEMQRCMVANFEKEIMYTDVEGNYINDRRIKIKIEFDSEFDYKKSYKNRDGDYVFNYIRGDNFIRKLLKNNYGSGKKQHSKTQKKHRKR